MEVLREENRGVDARGWDFDRVNRDYFDANDDEDVVTEWRYA